MPQRPLLTSLLALSLLSSAYAGLSPSPILEPVLSKNSGPYLTIQGGPAWISDTVEPGLYPLLVDFDTGVSAMAALGWRVSRSFSLEIESGFAASNFDFVYPTLGVRYEGEFKQVPVFLNALYVVECTPLLGLYIGAGAGATWSKIKIDVEEASDWYWAFQAKAGITYKIADALNFNLGYRGVYGLDSFAGEDEVLSNIAEIGLTYRF